MTVSSAASPAKPSRSAHRWRSSPLAWLAVAVGLYFVVAFVFSWVRALEFQTTTWDFGLYQQAIWSTAHGRPFYETADVETGGFNSLLQVHSVFLFYLLVPLYSVAPSALTLFAVQAAAVAAAAFPLYFLARELTGSARLGLVSGIVYLAWAPTLTSNLYDFHPEAFLPVELFALVYFWNRQRYGAGLAIAAVAFVTMELAPVLVFFAGLYFLLPSRDTWTRWREELRRIGWGSIVSREFGRALRSKRVAASLVLLVSSVLAYGILLYLRETYLVASLGTQPLPFGGSGYVIGATPAALGLSWANLGIGLDTKLSAWVLLFALLGFVPLLAPRSLVFVAPWAVFTFFSSNLNYVALGFQYGFIAASGLLLAFVFGLVELDRLRRILVILSRTSTRESASTTGGDGAGAGRGRSRRPRAVLLAGLAALVVVNVALTPVNPLMDGQGTGSAYRFSYYIPPGYDSVRELTNLVPVGATVIATDNLFPLVANDLNAYSFFWGPYNFLNLPFDATHLPEYALIAENRSDTVPAWLATALYTPADYGVRGAVWSSIVHAVLLFEKGYAGPIATFGPAPPSPSTYYGSPLAVPGTSYVTSVAGTRFPQVVRSAPGAIGPMWAGPGLDLDPGNYTVTAWLSAQAWAPAFPPSGGSPVLSVGAIAFGLPYLYNRTVSFAAINSTTWVPVSFSLDLVSPTIEFSVFGSALDPSATITLEYLAVAP